MSITNYYSTNDWFYLVTAVIVVDVIGLFLARYPGENPFFKVKTLNKWYDKFGIFAIGSDVLSILIGLLISRFIYTIAGLKNELYFFPILLLVQLIHDAIFYFLVIKPMSKGHNEMIDVFKEYAEENGTKVLGSDAIIMVSSALIGSLLKSLPDHFTIATHFITLYALCYILFTRSPPSLTQPSVM